MGKRILVVDDNQDSLIIMRTILQNHGYEVSVAGSGNEALDRLTRAAVDVVLLDVMMPDMNGFQVLQRIKEAPATAQVPVIMVTAKTQDQDLIDGYQYGADYYITKPFTARQLLYGIELILGKGASASGRSVES